jgi:HAD superfamily phosphoserine phosphatase-like hydrolase
MKYCCGKWKFFLVMGLFTPLIFYYVYVRKEGEIAKRIVLSFLFKGWTKEKLDQVGESFAKEVLPSLLIPAALEEIELHKKRRDRVIIISASLENWLRPWTERMKLELICTELAYENGKFTGSFATPNCNGQEKVNRIKAHLDTKDYNPVFAYGNSSGDKPMLALADHGFYRHFG